MSLDDLGLTPLGNCSRQRRLTNFFPSSFGTELVSLLEVKNTQPQFKICVAEVDARSYIFLLGF